ncbi:MAG: ABC transporter permease [Deltaproteobacteria bacterium]|nr:ABC transporter permease [Deltaproteobacteria bacterium]
MIRSLPVTRRYTWLYRAYIAAFLVYLFAPLVTTSVLAFNDSLFPALPWAGGTLDWFFGSGPERVGFFHDAQLLNGLAVSFRVAALVAVLSVTVGTATAMLFAQESFPFKNALYFLMLAPLVIPGVILGVSILSAANAMGLYLEDHWGIELELVQPGLPLVVLGQFSFIATLATLIILARLRKFDPALEEAALNLGANRFTIVRRILLPFLRPALIGATVVSFLMSFENFNTTLFLVGSKATFPVTLYLQVRDGSTPVINAASLVLLAGTGILAILNLLLSRRRQD